MLTIMVMVCGGRLRESKRKQTGSLGVRRGSSRLSPGTKRGSY